MYTDGSLYLLLPMFPKSLGENRNHVTMCWSLKIARNFSINDFKIYFPPKSLFSFNIGPFTFLPVYFVT